MAKRRSSKSTRRPNYGLKKRKRSHSKVKKSRSHSKRRKTTSLRLRGRSVARVSGRNPSARKPTKPKRSLQRQVLQIINNQIAPHSFILKRFSANISWAAGSANWIITLPPADCTNLTANATLMEGTLLATLQDKIMHTGTVRKDTICNMGTLPMNVDIWAMTARHDLPGAHSTPAGSAFQLWTIGNLIVNDEAIYGSNLLFTEFAITPFDYPSLRKYYKIKLLGTRKIGGLKALQLTNPTDYSTPVMEPRSGGPLGNATYGGMYSMRKGQTCFIFKVYGEMGPDITQTPLNSLTMNVATGLYTAVDHKSAGAVGTLARSSGACFVMTETHQTLKKLQDNTVSVYFNETAQSAVEPLQMRPLETQRWYT